MEKYVPFFQGEKRSITERLAAYFEQHGIDSKINYDEEKEAYILSVPADKENEAKKRYQDFYFSELERVEMERKNNPDSYDLTDLLTDEATNYVYPNIATMGTSSDDAENSFDDTANDEASDPGEVTYDTYEYDNDPAYAVTAETEEDTETVSGDSQDENQDEGEDDEKATVRRLMSGSGNYVFKSEKYKDYTGTVYIFLILGIAGIIFVILNVTKVLTLLQGFFPNLVMGALFLFFIFEAIAIGKKAKKLKAEIEEENKLTDKINEWLRNTVTKEFLTSISNDQLSEELDYIKKAETIRDMLIKEFGEQNHDYLDRLIEEYYSKTFDASDNYTE